MPTKNKIYLDNNAGAPLHPKVKEELAAFLHSDPPYYFSNPSSIHSLGQGARSIVETARASVSSCVGARPSEILFASSGTEANQTVVRSFLQNHPKALWVTSEIEHASLLDMRPLVSSSQQALLSVLPSGVLDLSSLINLLEGFSSPVLLSLGWVNNETGVIQPVEEIIRIARQYGAKIHLDAAQALGKIPIDVGVLDVDFLTFSSHKVGGLSGIGAVYVKEGISHLVPLFPGSQEMNRRGGTENIAGIFSFGVACRELNSSQFQQQVEPLSRHLEDSLNRLPGVQINGGASPRVCNTVNFTLKDVHGEGLVAALDLAGFCVSAGSACAAGAVEPSHVLRAMGLSKDDARSSLRVSLSSSNTLDEVQQFVEALKKIQSRFSPHTHDTNDAETGCTTEMEQISKLV